MEKEVMMMVAGLMELAARTAPKAIGKDYLTTKVIGKDELETFGNEMVAFGIRSNKKNFDRDGINVKNSDAVLLIALSKPGKVGLNCGACGFDKCEDLPAASAGTEFAGPICAWRIIDLGVALGSAAKTASILNADNRIMYRIGAVARELGLIEGEIVVGIPISATGKNIFFDR